MNNITPIRPTQKITVHAVQVKYELVPPDVIEEVFHTAISVAWAQGDDEAFIPTSDDYKKRLEALQAAVSEVTQYAIPVTHEIDAPI